MATIHVILGIICLVSTFGNRLPGGDFLSAKVENVGLTVERVNCLIANCKLPIANRNLFKGWQLEDLGFSVENEVKIKYSRLSTFDLRLLTLHSELPAKILHIAGTQIGVREAKGKNDGLAVEAYLKYTGNIKGEPWCASFVSWVFGKAGLAMPRSAWSPALFPKNRQTLNPLPADVFGIYFEKYQRIAHCGLVESTKGSWVYTIEGNTNVAGSREGDGVFRKLRHHRTIAVYANWFKPKQKGELK